MGKLNSISSYEGSTLLESLDIVLEEMDSGDQMPGGTDDDIIMLEDAGKIKAPFNKYYNEVTIDELCKELGEDPDDRTFISVNELPGYDEFNIVGHALAKEEYFEALMDNGIGFADINEDGRLLYSVKERVFEIEADEVLSAVGEDTDSLEEAPKNRLGRGIEDIQANQKPMSKEVEDNLLGQREEGSTSDETFEQLAEKIFRDYCLREYPTVPEIKELANEIKNAVGKK